MVPGIQILENKSDPFPFFNNQSFLVSNPFFFLNFKLNEIADRTFYCSEATLSIRLYPINKGRQILLTFL